MQDQLIIFTTLIVTLGLFIWGKWRYDLVSIFALLVVSLAGIVPTDEIFSGFGHPAVITVAAVLILSRGLQNSGFVDLISGTIFKLGKHPIIQITILTSIVAFFSAFMNNIGALAIMLPIAIAISRKTGTPPSLLLMPLAFGSLLGGLTTMIGTPPNIVIAMARAEVGAEPFKMFDFTPVGLGVAVAGILFISLIGWRFLPHRKAQKSPEDLFHVKDYITEVRVKKNSKIVDKKIRELGSIVKDVEVNIVGIGRGKRKIVSPQIDEYLEEGDILVVEADSDDLKAFVEAANVELASNKKLSDDVLGSEEMNIVEAVVMADSPLVNKTAFGMNLRRKYGMNLLAVARKGDRVKERLASIKFRPGDVLLLSGPGAAVYETLQELGCIPLAQRNFRIGQEKRIILSIGIFATAVASAAIGLIPIQVAFISAALIMVAIGLISLKELYESIDWSIIILLGALIPVGIALETTGGAQTIANGIILLSGASPPVVTLAILLVSTMFLSDVINNAAAAVLMAPIAIQLATGLGVSPDPFLIGVALAASCAFLTPIGHQSNTLVLGPGGYKFGDYWRLGLPLEIVILLVGIPLIVWVWPF